MVLLSAPSLKMVCVALTFSATSATFYAVSALPAFAEKGGNGNSNGRNNRRNRDDSRAERSNNGRGHIARELRHLNAAHANANALANASPNSVPGQLNLYREAHQSVATTQSDYDLLLEEYERLANLDEPSIATEFPQGGYEAALAMALEEYLSSGDDLLGAQSTLEESLATLTRGQELSEAAMEELLRLLEL